MFYVSDLVQVVGQTAVETLHGFLIVGAVAMYAVKFQADWPVEILADGGRAAQRAGCSERYRSTGASAASIHQRATGKGRLTAQREAPHRHAGGHDELLSGHIEHHRETLGGLVKTKLRQDIKA